MTNLDIINRHYGEDIPEYIWADDEYSGPQMYHVNCGEPNWIGSDADCDPTDMVYSRVRFGDIRTTDEAEYTDKLSETYTVLSPDSSADLRRYIEDQENSGFDTFGTPLEEVELDIWTDRSGTIGYVRAVDWE